MKRSKCGVIERVIGFLESVLMGCFFSCFRIRDDDRSTPNMIAKSISSQYKDSLLPKKKIDSGFVCQGSGSSSAWPPYSSAQKKLRDNNIGSDLEHQVKYLRSCGALLEAPEELHKLSDKLITQSDDEDAPSEFHSWLPGTSFTVLHSNEFPDSVSDSATKVYIDSCLPEKEHASYNCEESEVPGKAFQFQMTMSSGDKTKEKYGTSDLSPFRTESKIQTSCSSESPYATPLNLTDEMQTPGTVYPGSMENVRTGKHARIRTQHVYPVLKPVENLPEWNTLREVYNHYLSSGGFSEHQTKSSKVVPSEKMSFTSGPKVDKRSQDEHNISREEPSHFEIPSNSADSTEQLNLNLGTPKIFATSLSERVESLHPKDEREANKNITKARAKRTYDADRPIIGLVASHWTNEESSLNIAKWWNGNGIPNSTKKYKEDQKVSWHATPFEERLDKVLSDEKLLPHRILQCKRPIEFESEESDVAEH